MKFAQRANDNDPPPMEVEVAERYDQPGVWTVEAIDVGSEGEIYQAFFTGPNAKERALSYAGWAYGLDTSTSM